MIVADTGGILVLLDRNDPRHTRTVKWYRTTASEWVLPWAILPEVDYLAGKHLGQAVAHAFAADVRDGLFHVDANVERDLPRAVALLETYDDLNLGIVDTVVMAQAERHAASAIATTDARHFRAVRLLLKSHPRLVPVDED